MRRFLELSLARRQGRAGLLDWLAERVRSPFSMEEFLSTFFGGAMGKYYAGLDVSRETTAICIVDERGHKVFEASTPSDPQDIVAALGPYRALLENVGHETGALAPWRPGYTKLWCNGAYL